MSAEFDRQYMLQRLDDFRATVAQADASYKKLLAQIDVNKKAHDQTIGSAGGGRRQAKLDMKTLPVLSAMDSERRKLALEEAEARLDNFGKRSSSSTSALPPIAADLELQHNRG
jgi:multidrug resistance efflux pump